MDTVYAPEFNYVTGEPSSHAITNFSFCYLTAAKNNMWGYDAALGFGRFNNYTEFLDYSYVGRLVQE